MKTNIYSIHDSKARAYGSPFLLTTDGLAQRSFIQACLSDKTEFAKYPLDYTLFRIGTYDDETAIVMSEAPPEMLLTAMQAMLIAEKETQKITELAKQSEDTENEISNDEST